MARKARPRRAVGQTEAAANRVVAFDGDALSDLERIVEFNLARAPGSEADHVVAIRTALEMLALHPEIGRPIGGASTLRELIISSGKTGYVALYEFSDGEGLVRVVAVRHQREAGYRSGL